MFGKVPGPDDAILTFLPLADPQRLKLFIGSVCLLEKDVRANHQYNTTMKSNLRPLGIILCEYYKSTFAVQFIQGELSFIEAIPKESRAVGIDTLVQRITQFQTPLPPKTTSTHVTILSQSFLVIPLLRTQHFLQFVLTAPHVLLRKALLDVVGLGSYPAVSGLEIRVEFERWWSYSRPCGRKALKSKWMVLFDLSKREVIFPVGIEFFQRPGGIVVIHRFGAASIRLLTFVFQVLDDGFFF